MRKIISHFDHFYQKTDRFLFRNNWWKIINKYFLEQYVFLLKECQNENPKGNNLLTFG